MAKWKTKDHYSLTAVTKPRQRRLLIPQGLRRELVQLFSPQCTRNEPELARIVKSKLHQEHLTVSNLPRSRNEFRHTDSLIKNPDSTQMI